MGEEREILSERTLTDEDLEPRSRKGMRLTPSELAVLSSISAVICTFAALVGLVAFFTKSVQATLIVSTAALAVLVLGTVGVIRGWPNLARTLHVPPYLLVIGVVAVVGAGFGGYSLRATDTAPPFVAPPTSSTSSPAPGLRPPKIPKADTTELNSPNQSTEASGIEALQKLIKESPSYQPAAIIALANFMRGNSPAGNSDQQVTRVIQAALNVLRSRDTAHDEGVVITLSNTNLTDANLSGINLAGAILINTDFTSANLTDANFTEANLSYAYVGEANLTGANLDRATLANASFPETPMCDGSKPIDSPKGYNCSE